MRRGLNRNSLIVFALLAAWALLIGRSFADVGNSRASAKKDVTSTNKSASAAQPTAPERMTTAMLGGSRRYLTFVSTDKPLYQTGEKLYVRGVLLDAANHEPLPNPEIATPNIQITGPNGDTVASGTASTQDSVWGFEWQVPQAQAGGEYTIVATYPSEGYAPAERKFDIRVYRAPRLKSQITFLRDGYGPGEKVHATLDVKRAEGGIPEGAKVTVTAVVDGIPLSGGTGKVDAQGLCPVSLDLPKEILRGEGTLALVIEDGGVVETASKTIPILLQSVDLQLFPEGGNVIAGYKNRVYIQAVQPNGKPADLVGKLFAKRSSRLETIADFRTEHEGRGRFEFTPDGRSEYFLKIDEPSGIKKTYALPKSITQGALIRADREVFKKDQAIGVQVGCTSDHCRVTLAKREVEVATKTIESATKKGELVPISFEVPSNVDGVLTVTVWDKKGIPLAERLIFREPAKRLNISLKSERKNYIPGDIAKVTVKATDSDGKPVSTIVGLTVTDDSVLEMVEKREQAPRLPVMVFLEPEVLDLADAAVYLDPNNSKAPLATDLLLGTQGWRRFAFIDASKFVHEHGDSALRVMAVKTPAPGLRDLSSTGSFFPFFARPAQGPPSLLPWVAAVPNAAKVQLRNSGINKAGVLPPQTTGIVPDGMKAKIPSPSRAVLPDSIDRVEGPRDMNMFQVAPTVIDERHYTSGRSERHQRTNPMLPEGSPIPDDDGFPAQAKVIFPPSIPAVRRGGQPSRQFQRRGALIRPRNVGPGNFILVREFAHPVRADRKPTDREDFSQTLYWNAGVKTDPIAGEATINFGLSDSVTTFRVFADGFANDGTIGAASIGVESVQPFYAEAKLPLEVTAGDRIELPVSLVNATTGNLTDADISVDLKGDFKLEQLLKGKTSLGAGERVRWIQPIDVGFDNGKKDFVLNAKSGAYADKVSRTIAIKPKGFPTEVAFGGILEPGKPVIQTVDIPTTVVPKSLVSNTGVYPTPLANLTEALQRMIQDPSGCFEQTSSTSYPLTMAQQYFLTHTGVDPKLVESAREKLDAGYKRLVSFWCPDRGYEWFGKDPGHEALTAYGLLHFADMSQVREVDQSMVATTRDWLLRQKDGKGGFTRKARSLHSWIEDKDCSNSYILWALLETGVPPSELKEELTAMKSYSATSQNYYVVALAANAFSIAGDKPTAKKLMDRLVTKQKTDGSLGGVTSSIVGSGGQSLEVEGTAFATLAWLRDPAYAGSVEKSIKFLADSCKDGRYGSTQATVLALRAIVTYDKQRAQFKEPGKVRLYVDGQSIGDWVAFDKSTQGAIKMPDMSELLTAGEHKLELRMEGGGPLPYSMALKYNADTPASAKDCQVGLTTKLAQSKIVEGTATEALLTIFNKTHEVIPNPVAIVGLPGGLEPRHDQLKELVKKGTIDSYEVLGRDVVLYWRGLPADAKIAVPISVIAAVPGNYTGSASRAYLYYTDEQKQWVDGLNVEIAAK